MIQLPEFTQTHVHRVSDPIQPSHPLSSPSPPALNPSQDQSRFQWVNSSHDDAVKVLHSICQQIWKTQQLPQDWKRLAFVPIHCPKKGNANECSNYRTIALISQASEVMLKILHPGFSNTWTVNFQMFKLVLEKAKEPEIKLPTSFWSLRKQESSRKTSTSAQLTMPKPLTVQITTNSGKFLKRWEYQTTWPASWETCM